MNRLRLTGRTLLIVALAIWWTLATVILTVAIIIAATRPAAAQTTRAEIEREMSGAFERSEWTRAERRAFTLSVLAHSLDLASSLASDERCVERNPLLGSHPSDGALIATKLLALGFEFWLYSSPRFRHAPTHMYGYTSALIHGAVAASNFRNDCY